VTPWSSPRAPSPTASSAPTTARTRRSCSCTACWSTASSGRGCRRARLAGLELTDVTLVGNDTGGALCQFTIDTDQSRIGRLVLTNCDAFDAFAKPVHLVWGDADPFFPISFAERLAAAFPNATLTTVPGGRTFVSMEFPSRSARLLRRQVRACIQSIRDRHGLVLCSLTLCIKTSYQQILDAIV